ncbi:hypothetical protein BC940DRAFT_315586 [Gongronella butleri]|nr:hypothetical protein BC940DRAFT_315586 [Gongronella butleri]
MRSQAKRATPPITSNSSNSTSSSSSRSGAKPSSGVTGLSPSSVAKDKTVPMKELEKLLTDLKRENFDLKLRLFHLESAMTKEMDKFWLQSENERLQKEVEMKHGQVEALEDELTHLKETVRFGISCDSKGTQTDELPIMNAASSGPETRMDTPITTAIGATAEKTRFPSDAASFGLISRQLGRHVASAVAHEASKYDEIDCDQFQQRVHIASPQYRGRWRQ